MEEELTISAFVDAWPLFKDSVNAGVVAGVLLGFLGVYIVARKMVFFSAAMSQTASLGVAAAYAAPVFLLSSAKEENSAWWTSLCEWLGTSPTLGASVLTVAAALSLLGGTRKRDQSSGDGVLGVLFLIGAAGTVLLGKFIVQEVQDIDTLLFGSAVAVLPEDAHRLYGAAAVIAGLHIWWHRGFVLTTVDARDASVRGVPTRILETTLLLSLAIGIALCTQVIGAMPTFAFSVLPAMVAMRLANTLPRALWLAGILGGSAAFGGYLLAFLWDLPVGATQTALCAAVFVAVAGISKLRR